MNIDQITSEALQLDPEDRAAEGDIFGCRVNMIPVIGIHWFLSWLPLVL